MFLPLAFIPSLSPRLELSLANMHPPTISLRPIKATEPPPPLYSRSKRKKKPLTTDILDLEDHIHELIQDVIELSYSSNPHGT